MAPVAYVNSPVARTLTVPVVCPLFDSHIADAGAAERASMAMVPARTLSILSLVIACLLLLRLWLIEESWPKIQRHSNESNHGVSRPNLLARRISMPAAFGHRHIDGVGPAETTRGTVTQSETKSRSSQVSAALSIPSVCPGAGSWRHILR